MWSLVSKARWAPYWWRDTGQTLHHAGHQCPPLQNGRNERATPAGPGWRTGGKPAWRRTLEKPPLPTPVVPRSPRPCKEQSWLTELKKSSKPRSKAEDPRSLVQRAPACPRLRLAPAGMVLRSTGSRFGQSSVTNSPCYFGQIILPLSLSPLICKMGSSTS